MLNTIIKGKVSDYDQLRRLVTAQEKELNDLRGNELQKIEKDGTIQNL